MMAKNKKLDQLYVSKAEYKKYSSLGQAEVRSIVKDITADFEHSYETEFGAKALRRLKKTAKARKRSTLGYALDVLMKK